MGPRSPHELAGHAERGNRWGVVVVPLLLALAGCLDDATATIQSDSDGGPTSLQGTATCQDTATLELALNVRAGNLHVRVMDGAGAIVFNETYEAPDGGETSRGLFGAPGTWRLVADSTDFDGRIDATLSC